MSAKPTMQDYADFVAFQLAANGNARLRRPTPRFFAWTEEARAEWRETAEKLVAGWAQGERAGLARARQVAEGRTRR